MGEKEDWEEFEQQLRDVRSTTQTVLERSEERAFGGKKSPGKRRISADRLGVIVLFSALAVVLVLMMQDSFWMSQGLPFGELQTSEFGGNGFYASRSLDAGYELDSFPNTVVFVPLFYDELRFLNLDETFRNEDFRDSTRRFLFYNKSYSFHYYLRILTDGTINPMPSTRWVLYAKNRSSQQSLVVEKRSLTEANGFESGNCLGATCTLYEGSFRVSGSSSMVKAFVENLKNNVSVQTPRNFSDMGGEVVQYVRSPEGEKYLETVLSMYFKNNELKWVTAYEDKSDALEHGEVFLEKQPLFVGLEEREIVSKTVFGRWVEVVAVLPRDKYYSFLINTFFEELFE